MGVCRQDFSELVKFFFLLFDAIFMEELFLTYGGGDAAIYSIIGVLIMLIYKSHAHALRYTQVDHLYRYLRLIVFASDMTCSYKPFISSK